MKTLSRRQRLLNQIRGDEIDRVPTVGGWMLGVRNVAALADLSVPDFLADPLGGVLRANHLLGADAIEPPIVPVAPTVKSPPTVMPPLLTGETMFVTPPIVPLLIAIAPVLKALLDLAMKVPPTLPLVPSVKPSV